MKTENHDLFLEWYEDKNRIVYEGKHVVAYVAEVAVVKGHLLVVPKKDYTSIFDVPAEVRHELYDVAVMLAERAMKKLNAKGVQITENENMYEVEPDNKWHVSHIHLHVHPRYSKDDIKVQLNRVKLSTKEINDCRELLSTD